MEELEKFPVLGCSGCVAYGRAGCPHHGNVARSLLSPVLQPSRVVNLDNGSWIALRLDGNWFNLSPEDRAFVEGLAQSIEDFEAKRAARQSP